MTANTASEYAAARMEFMPSSSSLKPVVQKGRVIVADNPPWYLKRESGALYCFVAQSSVHLPCTACSLLQAIPSVFSLLSVSFNDVLPRR